MASLQDLVDPQAMGVDPSTSNPLTNLVGNALQSLATLPQRAIQNSQFSLDTGNYDPSVPVEAALTMMGGSGAMPAEANSLRMGIKAYHGSPHDFDAFDLSKIGTGEGAQAYGHGLYFADKEGVAQSYRDALAKSSNPNHDPNNILDSLIQQNYPDEGHVVGPLGIHYPTGKNVVDAVAQGRLKQGDIPDEIYNEAKKYTVPGKMYEVNINADPEHFLDWDKPLSEQPQSVQDLWAKQFQNDSPPVRADIPVTQGAYVPDARSGAEIYKNIADKSALQQAGVPGIKYLDQGSRAAGDGSRNYVVFNDKLVDIIKKYGMAGISALPPSMAAAVSQHVKPVDHDPFAGAVKGPDGTWHKLNQT